MNLRRSIPADRAGRRAPAGTLAHPGVVERRSRAYDSKGGTMMRLRHTLVAAGRRGNLNAAWPAAGPRRQRSRVLPVARRLDRSGRPADRWALVAARLPRLHHGYTDQLLKLVRAPSRHLQLWKLGCNSAGQAAIAHAFAPTMSTVFSSFGTSRESRSSAFASSGIVSGSPLSRPNPRPKACPHRTRR